MSTLRERLQRIKENFTQQAPPEAITAINNSNESIRASGLLSKAPTEGDILPSFDLEDTEGHLSHSEELIKRGPLVLTFYRGLW